MQIIYIAGAISSDNILTSLGNISAGIHAANRVMAAGHAPFCPHLDFQTVLAQLPEQSISVDTLKGVSMKFLEHSNVVWVLPNSEESAGTQAEIARAIELDIPVYYDFDPAMAWADAADKLEKEVDMMIDESLSEMGLA